MIEKEFERLKRDNKVTTGFGIAVSLTAAIISLLFGAGKSTMGAIILLGVFGFVVIFFLTSWVGSIIASKVRMIENNFEKTNKIEKDLNRLTDRLDLHKDISDLKSQISFFERMGDKRMGKRGAIDPRWVIIIIIIILLYLFLKQQGLFS